MKQGLAYSLYLGIYLMTGLAIETTICLEVENCYYRSKGHDLKLIVVSAQQNFLLIVLI